MKFILFLICLSQLTLASTNTKEGLWFGTFAKKEFMPTHFFTMEVQVRYNLSAGETGQMLYRTGITKQLPSGNEVSALYGHITTNKVIEHRITTQHAMTFDKLSNQNVKYSSRARIEYRTLEDVNGDSFRFRYLFRSDIKKEYYEYTPVIWNELFLNITNQSWNGDQTFERNRLFVGLRGSFYDSNYEFGYLNQYVPRKSQDTMEHIAVFYLFF